MSQDKFAGTAGTSLTARLAERLSEVGEAKDYAAGDVIFKQSDPGESWYVIEKGTISLFFEHERSPKSLNPGAFFGELALLTEGYKRTATAVASTDARLKVLNRDLFNDLLETEPSLIAQLLRQISSYLVESEQNLISHLRRKNRELEQSLDYLKRTREELDTAELRALTDGLTGIYNRRCLDRRVEVLLASKKQQGTGMALILVDLDGFKAVNDNHGHHVGDLLLKNIADALKDVARRNDFPFRLGGDEFAMVLTDTTEDDASDRAKKILMSIGSLRIKIHRDELGITVSVGGTMYKEGESWEEFYRRADRSLYQAKESGRNRVAWR